MARSARRRLSASERARVPELLGLAEELTAEHYRLPSFDAESLAYDVLTLDELKPEEIDDEALAVLHRYEREERGAAPRSFFRICLQDHNFLDALEREGDIAFEDLLLFVLTHELVHIVRFGSFLQIFGAPEEERLAEEQAVHETTRAILTRLGRGSLERVLSRWEGSGGPDVIRYEAGR